jgi:hypothetical protein
MEKIWIRDKYPGSATLVIYTRRVYMIYRGPGFLVVGYDLALPLPPFRLQAVSLSRSSCVFAGRAYRTEGGGGGAEEANSCNNR